MLLILYSGHFVCMESQNYSVTCAGHVSILQVVFFYKANTVTDSYNKPQQTLNMSQREHCVYSITATSPHNSYMHVTLTINITRDTNVFIFGKKAHRVQFALRQRTVSLCVNTVSHWGAFCILFNVLRELLQLQWGLLKNLCGLLFTFRMFANQQLPFI